MNKIFIIDGNAYIHRAYHALPPLTTSKGMQINAVYGFIKMILKIIKNEKPDFIVVCFDSAVKTFRHTLFPEYKATRKKIDEQLYNQIPLVKEAVKVLGLTYIEKEGYEADDIIATIVKTINKINYKIIIISGDKDILQLVDDNVTVLNEHKNILFNREEVYKKYGVYPDKLVDMFALVGDKIDNIPGVPGIGEKTAVKLINNYGSIENIFSNYIKDVPYYKLIKYKSIIELSKKLLILNSDVPINIDINSYKIKEPNRDELITFMKKLEFSNLLKELIPQTEINSDDYKSILTENNFVKLLEELNNSNRIFIELLSEQQLHNSDIIGIGIGILLNRNLYYYIPLNHKYINTPKQLDYKYVLDKLKPFLESENIKKYGHNLKSILLNLNKYKIELKGIEFDTMIASYVLNPSRQNHDLESLAIEYLSEKIQSKNELTKKNPISKVSIEQTQKYICKYIETIFKLTEVLKSLLKEKKLYDLFYQIEMPLITILYEMEKNGIKIDINYLKNISIKFQNRINNICQEIYKLTGQEFNLNSPKQLAFILFEKQKLPVIRKTKTGYSTDEEVLRELSNISDIAKKILEYRELQKLKSTYIDNLLNLVNPTSSRIHTSFNQTVTSTGRLSSSNPNLQNIPIKTELGREIRKAFIPEDNCIFISADYSQIDLRVLAHMSKDESLCNAFLEGKDIHTSTAAELFNIEPSKVSSDLRRIAKTINFGIIYGMSAFGLSQQLNINPEEAENYINNYFKKYVGVKKWIEQTLLKAKTDGYVSTLFNRIRYLPEINSNNNQIRLFAERVAINTPIQGTSADIIKIAMINIYNKLLTKNKNIRLLLQIHDDLLFEVNNSIQIDINNLISIIVYEMENAAKLSIPLIVNIKYGKNWDELKEYEKK